MADRIGVAVIGAGYWGKKLVSEYLPAEKNGLIKLVKVCDPSLPALGGLLITKQTSSIDQSHLTQKVSDVMQDPEILAVHIATPNPTHYPLAKMALEAGKHVLVEKPMTLNSRQAYELVELAKSRGLVIHVGHVFRFNSALSVARELLDKGELGKLFYVRIQWTDQAFFPDRDIVFDLGPHPVDILNQLFGTWPQQLTGISRGFRGDRGEVAYVIAEFPNDMFAHVELSWLHPTKVREVTIVGSKATLSVDCIGQTVRKSNHEYHDIPVKANNTIALEISNFIDCIVRHDISSESGLIGAHTVETLEHIRSSIWDRPLPIMNPAHTSTDSTFDALELLSARKVTSEEIERNSQLQRSIGRLLKSGLVTRTLGEGMYYELTEAGSSFLERYHEITPSPSEELPPVKVREPEPRREKRLRSIDESG
jgi:predicted dehydrogenase